MNKKVLIVDDDQNILDSFNRQLRRKFQIHTALGPEEGFRAIESLGPFAVIVSDLQMPVIDGIKFLSRAKKISPDTVRIMLTGNADLQNAINAVNEGSIFSFLTKPCSTESISIVLAQAIEQYRLVTAEKELLEKTLKGSIKILVDVLSMLNPEAFGRASRIRRYAGKIATHLKISGSWQIETSALLSQIGYITLPEETLQKMYKGEDLSLKESKLFAMHPVVASDLLSNIPRMEPIAEIIKHQDNVSNGSESSTGKVDGSIIPFGSRILKVVLDFDMLESKGYIKVDALKYMRVRSELYDPEVLDAMEAILGSEAKYATRTISVKELISRMILIDDVVSENDELLLSRGQEVNEILIKRLNNFINSVGVKEPIRVIVPMQVSEQDRSPEDLYQL